MFILVQDEQVARYPYSVGQFRAEFRNVSLPAEPTLQQLAEVGLFQVAQTSAPTPSMGEVVEANGVALVDGVWTQQWSIRPATPSEIAQQQADLVTQYDHALANHLDSVAQSKRYDNRISCSVRAGYPGPFQAEGQAFAAWMDTCNATAYQWWAEIEAGTKPMFASTQEFISALPVMVWPN